MHTAFQKLFVICRPAHKSVLFSVHDLLYSIVCLLCVCLPVGLPVCVFACLCVCLSVCLPVWVLTCLSFVLCLCSYRLYICLSPFCPPVYLYDCRLVYASSNAIVLVSYLFVRLPFCLSICLSVLLSICLSVCLSVFLSVCVCIFFKYLYVCLSVLLSYVFLSSLSVCLSVRLPVFLSILKFPLLEFQ
jgi:hypothetical protein